MIPESSWRAWKVPEITYAQAFINGFPKTELPFLSKASMKVHQQVPKYRESIITIRLNPKTSEKKRSSPMKNNCGRCNVNIEETGRRRGRRWSKSNLRVRSLSLERTISKQKGKKYVSLFRQHIPTTEQEFKRPQKSGKKVNEKQRKGKETPQIFVDRVQKDKKRTRIDDSQVPYFLFLQSLVLGLWH